jgi:outer membrane protein OmpA-like peptidoglycan-associated protein
MTLDCNGTQKISNFPAKSLGAAFLASALALALTTGCSTKNYVRTQTGPLIQQTNELDAKTAEDHRNIQDTDQRAQAGITKAQSAADQANQHAVAAGQSADQANQSAEDAVNHVQTLEGVVSNLDKYNVLSDVSVTFGFDKSKLTEADRDQLDQLASNLQNSRGYILALTGGTDSVGDAQYNYQLSQRRADAVVLYLASKYNIAPHRFYEIGIGKDSPPADNHTKEGRAENRRVEIKLMSNMAQTPSSAPVAPAGGE